MTSPRALSLQAFFTLLLIALMMASNHIAARVAFNSGLDVATAVATRSLVTACVVAFLLVVAHVSWRFNRQQGRGLLLVGLMSVAPNTKTRCWDGLSDARSDAILFDFGLSSGTQISPVG